MIPQINGKGYRRMNAQFSIYKINQQEVPRVPGSTNDTTQNTNSVVNRLIRHVVRMIKDRKSAKYDRVEYSGFCGVFFKTVHKPNWEGIANQILRNNQYADNQEETSIDTLENTNVSYVLFYPYNNDVYAVTGGYGSHYISRYIEKNFGLYLLPKLIDSNDSVVKSIIQNNLLGNQTATQKTNKLSTSISLERDTSSIFRQLNVEIDRDVAEEIGITFGEDESESKKVNMANKDSIVIHRSISLSNLKGLIESLWELENSREDNFALNYLVLAKKKRIKNTDLFNKLLETIGNGEFDRFLLTGDDYTTFYTGADQYVLYDEQNNELINQETPIIFSDVIRCVPKSNEKYTKTALQTMLKRWSISTFENAGDCRIYRLSIFDAIQGFVEFGPTNIHCYLFNGMWYVFEERFTESLTNDFRNLYDQQNAISDAIDEKFDLRHPAANEDTYNLGLRNRTDIIVAHTVSKNNVEVADAIFWDDQTIYLMHNKEKFDGGGARDLNNQILTAAEYLHQMLAYGGNEEFLGEYYDAIEAKYQKDNLTVPFDRAEFVQQFRSAKNVTYIAGYMKNYRRDSRATYAKYLTLETKKKLTAKGFSYVVLGIAP